MSFTESERIALACRASTLQERLAGHFLPVPSDTGTELAEARWQRWCETLGGQEALRQRLSWDGISEPHARACLGSVWPAEGQPWIDALARTLAARCDVAD